MVELLLGTGAGAFAAPTVLYAGDGGPVVVGDFNGDGRPDIAVETILGVDILVQNADGSFAAPRTVPLPGAGRTSGGANRALIAADFKGDGRLDLAFTDPCGGGTDVAFQQADGSFIAVQLAAIPGSPTALAAGDLTGAGRHDLAIGVGSPDTGTPATVLVYPATAGAAFGAATRIALPNSNGNWTLTVAIGDFDGDGKADLITTTYMTATAAVLYQQAGATVSAPQPLFIGPPVAQPVAVLDVTGDGAPDLVYMGGSVTLQSSALVVVPGRLHSR